MKEKATGWKVPLLACAGIAGCAALLGALLRQPRMEADIPDPLLEKATALRIDLSLPGNSAWRERILGAASGFSSRGTKDGSLAMLAREAAASGNYAASFAAAAQMRGAAAREELAHDLFKSTLQECAALPWSVFALRMMDETEQKREAAEILAARHAQCGKALE